MAETKKTFVCGHPIQQSRSPLIHNYWLRQHELHGSYERVDVTPENLKQFLVDIKAGAFLGGNFTLPHKETVFGAITKKDAAANAIGAVNTLWIEAGEITGGNTDAYGFSANLDDQIPQWRQAKRALIFGAGGASRAVIFALLEAGIKQIDLVNRTFERAEKLASDFSPYVTPYSWDEAYQIVPSADLLINTTAIGMNTDEEFPLDIRDAKVDALASDIVYIPLETPFLKAARQRGLKASDGLGMLLHQAVPGFEKWYGVRPSVTSKLRQLILNDIFGQGR